MAIFWLFYCSHFYSRWISDLRMSLLIFVTLFQALFLALFFFHHNFQWRWISIKYRSTCECKWMFWLMYQSWDSFNNTACSFWECEFKTGTGIINYFISLFAVCRVCWCWLYDEQISERAYIKWAPGKKYASKNSGGTCLRSCRIKSNTLSM